VRPRALDVVRDNLARIGTLWRELADGRVPLW
jgi:hypothetical protein